jgi:hypothetical protein
MRYKKKAKKRVRAEGTQMAPRDTESRGEARARNQSSGDMGARVADKGLRGKPKIVNAKKRARY